MENSLIRYQRGSTTMTTTWNGDKNESGETRPTRWKIPTLLHISAHSTLANCCRGSKNSFALNQLSGAKILMTTHSVENWKLFLCRLFFRFCSVFCSLCKCIRPYEHIHSTTVRDLADWNDDDMDLSYGRDTMWVGGKGWTASGKKGDN